MLRRARHGRKAPGGQGSEARTEPARAVGPPLEGARPGVRSGRSRPAGAVTDAAVVFTAALAPCLLFTVLAPHPPVLWDAAQYDHAARGIVAGQLDPQAWRLMLSRGPLYPLFLAGIYATVSERPKAVYVVQAIVAAFSCVVMYLLGRRLIGRLGGIVAAGLAAAYLPFWFLAGNILTEIPAILLLLTGLLLTIGGLEKGSYPWLAGGGVLTALAMLTRPTLLPILPLLTIATYLAAGGRGRRTDRAGSRRSRLLATGVLTLACLAPVAGWNRFGFSNTPLPPSTRSVTAGRPTRWTIWRPTGCGGTGRVESACWRPLRRTCASATYGTPRTPGGTGAVGAACWSRRRTA